MVSVEKLLACEMEIVYSMTRRKIVSLKTNEAFVAWAHPIPLIKMAHQPIFFHDAGEKKKREIASLGEDQYRPTLVLSYTPAEV